MHPVDAFRHDIDGTMQVDSSDQCLILAQSLQPAVGSFGSFLATSVGSESARRRRFSQRERPPFLTRMIFASGPIHQHSKPPSTSRSTPVMNDAAGLSKKIAGPTISSIVAMRPIGVSAANTFNCSATSGRLFIAVSV